MSKRKKAQDAVDLLIGGGLKKLDRNDLTDLIMAAVLEDVKLRMPGYWTLTFIKHDDKCISLSESYKSMEQFNKELAAPRTNCRFNKDLLAKVK